MYAPEDTVIDPILQTFGLDYSDFTEQSFVAWKMPGINPATQNTYEFPNIAHEGEGYEVRTSQRHPPQIAR